MATVTWSPEDGKPEDAADLERRIDQAVPLGQVKVTIRAEGWLVRALAPPGGCRSPGFAGRDASHVVAEILREAGYPAVV